MSFTSKNLQTTKRGGLTVLKGATFFFLGMSAVLFLTQAFDIVPSVGNRVQLIKEVLFTTDGSQNGTMGARIDGAGGDAYFAGTVTGTTLAAATLCLTGDSCITHWPTGGTASATPGGGNTHIQFNDNGSFSGEDNLIRDSVNGRLGIGTDIPTQRLDVDGSVNINGSALISGFIMGGIDVFSILGRVGVGIMKGGDVSIAGGQNSPLGGHQAVGGKLLLNGGLGAGVYGDILMAQTGGNVGIGTGTPGYKLTVAGTGKFSKDLIVDGSVGIGTNNPDGKFQVMGGIKAGDKITMWTDDNIGMGKISAFSGLIIDTKIAGGSIETMRITKEGYVGIGTTNPSAHLDVYGDVKVLGSIEGNGGFTGSVASGYVRYYPSDSSGHTNNTGLNTDSIWYITCTTPVTATGFMIYGMTGSYLATGSAYFSMFQRGQYDTFTYHLRAGETFAIDMKNACDHIIVSKQEYGKPAINYNGGNLILPNLPEAIFSASFG